MEQLFHEWLPVLFQSSSTVRMKAVKVTDVKNTDKFRILSECSAQKQDVKTFNPPPPPLCAALMFVCLNSQFICLMSAFVAVL